MALSCANSYVYSGDLAANGRVMVCLSHDDNTPYFDGFDIGPGGQANNSPQSAVTGFLTGSSNYTQDYNVPVGPGIGQEPGTHQCFWVDYTAAPGATQDVLILQRIGTNGLPEGDACELPFQIGDGGGNNATLSCANSLWT